MRAQVDLKYPGRVLIRDLKRTGPRQRTARDRLEAARDEEAQAVARVELLRRAAFLQLQAAALKQAAGGWKCHMCTFENKEEDRLCEQCLSASRAPLWDALRTPSRAAADPRRPVMSRAASDGSTSSTSSASRATKWTCTRCTLQNPKWRTSCDACGRTLGRTSPPPAQPRALTPSRSPRP